MGLARLRWEDNRPLLAFGAKGQDEAVLGCSRRETPKHRFVTSTQSITRFRLNAGLDSPGGQCQWVRWWGVDGKRDRSGFR